jgi:hypothetical protein
MADYSLIPVDHQPDFDDVSLVPVEYDPFSADDMVQQARSQFATQPQRLEIEAIRSDIGLPVQFLDGNKAVDRGDITGATQLAPSVAPFDDYNGQGQIGAQLPEFADRSNVHSYPRSAPSLNDDPKADSSYWPKSSETGSNQQQYSMASYAAYSKCVDKCLHLLKSPSGDLQSSEFRQCVGQCMGRL